LMGHATACASSYKITGLSPSPNRGESVADYIEERQPEQVRITTEDRTRYVLHSPSVVGDEIVSEKDGLSVPIADIVQLEVWNKVNIGRRVAIVVGGLYLGLWAILEISGFQMAGG
jgi:hypothetical protein